MIGSNMSQIAPAVENVELAAFVAIVDAGSFTQAARELRVARATLGRRLARLEERLGVRLLLRTTRSVSLTEIGESFYTQARRALEAVARAEAVAREESGELSGSLRVSMPPIADPALDELLLSFAERHPSVRMQVHLGTRRVDLLRDGYDVALRAGVVSDPGLIARRLMRNRLIAVASPAYLEQAGTPSTVAELSAHRCLSGFERGELPSRTWHGPDRQYPVEGSFSTNEMPLLHRAALRGLGIAQVPELLATDDLEAGRLVQVLPDELSVETSLCVVYPERTLLPRQVRAFIDALLSWKPAFASSG